MRALNKIILFGVVLAPLIFTSNTFPYISDTFASFTDTKHMDATITAAVWDTQDGLVGLSDLNFTGNSNKASEDNYSNNERSVDNSTKNDSAAGNESFNLTADNLTSDNQTADNMTEDNQTSAEGDSTGGSTDDSDAEAVNPVANFSSNITSEYAPLSVQFTDLSAHASKWNWDFGDGANSTEQSPTHTYFATGTYNVNLIAINGNGTDSKVGTITVSAKPISPVANFTSNATSGYAPLAVQFTDLSENATEWSWDFENDGKIDSIGKNPVYVYAASRNYTVNLTVSNANGTVSKLATITVLERHTQVRPVANFSTNVTSSFAPLSVQFDDSSNHATGWSWDFNNDDVPDSTEVNPVHVFENSGTYTVNLTVSNENGTDSKLATINVLEQSIPILPVANFSTNLTSGYAPLSMQFNDSSENETGWNWNFGDGSTSVEQNPIHTYSAAGTYTVNLTVSNANGTNSKLATITVLEKPTPVLPVANFIAKPTSGYAPLYVQFTDLSKNAVEWKWDFGDRSPLSPEQNPSHNYSKAGDYTVSLTVSNENGTGLKTQEITVQEAPSEEKVFPVANFIAKPTSGYAPLDVQFTDLSKNAVEWKWDFGDRASSSEQNPTHTYSAAGNYMVNLTVNNAAGQSTKASEISVEKSSVNNSVDGNSSVE
jgi:PKD repeat protein